MDPTNREPEAPRRDADAPDSASVSGEDAARGPVPARVVQLVAGDYLLTVNPVDGSEIEPCPPGRLPAPAERRATADRAERDRAAMPPEPAGDSGPALPLVGRGEVRGRLGQLLSRGRSVRLTGPAGIGRTALLDAVAADCADLAPDGVVRLNGRHRTAADLLQELFAAVHHAPLHRPDRAGLLAVVREIGAVVVLDDLEFGGAALDELLDATPECAFLLAATPGVAAPSAESHVEEVVLGGLDRTDCLELLEAAVGRPLTDEEADWAADAWVESDGLPLRFVQAGAVLRLREADVAEAGAATDERPFSIPEDGAPAEEPAVGLAGLPRGVDPAVPLAARLGPAARATLRLALALGGEVPHQAQLPALVGDTHADAAVGELLAAGLITAVGAHYRLAAGVAGQLSGAGYDDGDAAGRVLSVAQHYSWWAGHPSVTPERVAAEADTVLAALAALVSGGAPGQPAAAVLLARTAAPAFAGALHWSAWERGLRHGQEAARLAGEVGEEAYFHHELGVLALCTGNLDRARAELEASTGLRGVLADKRGAVASRRALALVADRSRPVAAPGPVPPQGPSGPSAARPVMPSPRTARMPQTPGGEEVPAARSEQSATPPSVGRPVAARAAFGAPAVDPDSVTTAAFRKVPAAAVGGSGAGRMAGVQSWAQKLTSGGARRNLVAAGAGVVLAAVLGTVVTLGATSGNGSQGGGDSKDVKPGPSASQQDGDGGVGADRPQVGHDGPAPVSGGRSSARPERSGTPGETPEPSGTPSGTGTPSPSGSGTPSGTPSQTRTPGDGDSTSPKPTGDPEPTGKPKPSDDPKPPTGDPKPTTDPKPTGDGHETPAPPSSHSPGGGSGSASAVGSGAGR
ncbi:ATP-binding protein [Streptomyces luteireticuli]|uniref:ATP-binding protein n=1 Tax=Streptomyces luteireticuli TaxID=173858 RepID=A0ABP3IJV3_9ACTN